MGEAAPTCTLTLALSLNLTLIHSQYEASGMDNLPD